MPTSRRFFSLGNRFLIPYLAFLGAFAPLGTDMYLPALPAMSETLDASNDLVALTISAFLLCFGFSMLVWGPVSDRYGRRPALGAGCVIFVVASVVIALSSSIWNILFWRCVQAFGAGAGSAISLAIVKDIMRGSTMEKVVSWMQGAVVLAPMIAPVLGGGLLLVMDWNGIFWCLALCGCAALAGVFCLRETKPQNDALPLLATFARMKVVLGNSHFLKPLLLFSALSMPFMSYLAVSAFIYQDNFQLSPQDYSLFFAFNASFTLLGPFAYLYFLRKFKRGPMLAALIAGICVCSLILIFVGYMGPWQFALPFAGVSFFGSSIRAPATILLMESIEGDNGIVTSLINCLGLAFGTLSMFIATLPFWSSHILAVSCIGLGVSGGCLAWWLALRKDY